MEGTEPPITEQSLEQSPESPQPFEGATITEEPRKDWLKIILFSLLGLTFLLGIAYGGYWYFSNNSKSKMQSSKSEDSPETPATVQEEPTSAIDEQTAGWKTYTNTKYGYSIKYPPNFEAGEGGMASGFIESAGAITLYDKDAEEPQFAPRLSINILTLGGGTLEARVQKHFTAVAAYSLSEEAKKNFKTEHGIDFVDNSVLSRVSRTLFRGRTAYEYSIRGGVVFDGIGEYMTPIEKHKYIWVSDNSTYLIYLSDDPITNQILSTFKFTEAAAADETAGWETYRGDSYLFKHPPEWDLESGKTLLADGVKFDVPGLTINIVVNQAGFGYSCATIIKEEKALLGSVEATRTITRGVSDDLCDNAGNMSVWVSAYRGEDRYDLIFGYREADKVSTEATIDQLLSTFRFLD